jgi:uncharacterized membrane protein (DUF2068 family)
MDSELRRCGRHGHVFYVVTDDPVGHELEATGPEGLLRRCLRCGSFVTRPADPALESGPLAGAPLVPRGSHGRKMAILRLLAVERLIRALVLWAAAIAAWRLASSHDSAVAALARLTASARPLADQLGLNLKDSHVLHLLERSLSLTGNQYVWVASGLLAYGLLQSVEGVGLWGGHRWAEYLAVIATSVFLPLEVYEISHHATFLKVVAFIVNIAAVIYLVYKGRLFGVRGGHAAYKKDMLESTLLAELQSKSRVTTPQ